MINEDNLLKCRERELKRKIDDYYYYVVELGIDNNYCSRLLREIREEERAIFCLKEKEK